VPQRAGWAFPRPFFYIHNFFSQNKKRKFRGKNRFPVKIFLLSLEGHLRKVIWVLLCSSIYFQAALAFLVGNSIMSGLDSQTGGRKRQR
jgi:hypothetical protein